MIKKKSLVVSILLTLIIPLALAEGEQVVVNSQDWRDIYSGMLFASLQKDEGNYIVNEDHGTLLKELLDQEKQTLVIESDAQPYIRGYHTNLQAKGLTVETMVASDTLNLDLARQLKVDGYIILDDRYSYNAVSVVTYAVMKNYYVLFARLENIDEVVDLIDNERIILYGYVDREVADALLEFEPLIVDQGDKFSNNLEILKMYDRDLGDRQLILTNGAFLEPQFFTGVNPILFIGQDQAPEQTIEYIKDRDVKYATLIGYDLFDNAVNLKNKADLKIMVKFAKGINSEQYALDIFPLPAPQYNVEIISAEYNVVSKKLEITYENMVDFPTFVLASHNILIDNQTITVVGDENAIFLGGNDIVTIAYDLELETYDGLSVRSTILFGEDTKSLEYQKIMVRNIEIITYEDETELEIMEVFYDKTTKRFHVMIKNTGTGNLYAKPYLVGISINNKQETLTTDVNQIPEGDTQEFLIKAKLTAEDILDNEKIIVAVRYGVRQKSLVNEKETVFDFQIRSYATYYLVGTAIILVIIIILLLTKRRKKPRKHKIKPAPPPSV